jgi:hypothetical protein
VSSSGQIQNETWSFAGGNWTQRFPTVSPPAVFDPTAFYDGADQRPILFGGYTQPPGAYAPVAGTWTFSNGNWSNISASVTGSPSPRGSARAAWDPDQNWTLVFGGRASSVSLLDDTWGFPGAPLWGARLTSSASSLDLGSSVNLTATPTGGIAPYTFVYSGLPAGCPGANSSTLECTPTANGSFRVTVNVTDAAGHAGSANSTFTVYPRLALSLNASASELDLGESVTFTATSVGGAGGDVYTWTESAAGCSPSGHVLSCVPVSTSGLTVTAHVEDATAKIASSPPVAVRVFGAPSISLSISPGAVDLGQSLALNVAPVGGTGVYTFAYTGLPTGCTSANTTSLTCQPTGTGSFSVVAHLEDSLGVRAVSGTSRIAVAPRLLASFSDPTPTMVVGVAYGANATVSGGSLPRTFTWTELPPGCSGIGWDLQCSPTTAGTYPFQLVVQDAAGVSVDANGSAAVVLPVKTVMAPTGGSGGLLADPLFWIAIVAVVGVAAVLSVLLYRRRGPPTDTAPAPVSPPEPTGWVYRDPPPK